MSQLNNIVGKKIKTAYIRQKEGTGETQILLFFPDHSGCIFSSTGSVTQINTYEPFGIYVELQDGGFKTIEEATFDKEGTRKREVTTLFHSLWGQAGSGPEAYDKKKWNEMMSILFEADMIK